MAGQRGRGTDSPRAGKRRNEHELALLRQEAILIRRYHVHFGCSKGGTRAPYRGRSLSVSHPPKELFSFFDFSSTPRASFSLCASIFFATEASLNAIICA